MIKKIIKFLSRFWKPTTGDTIREINQKEIILNYINQNFAKTDNALDIGCGWGMYTRELLSKVKNITALDIDSGHNQRLTLRKLGINFIQGNAQHLPLQKDKYDLVLCTEVLEHLNNDEEGIQELERVAKKGGNIIISVPVPYDIKNYKPVISKSNNPKSHKREGYSIEEINKRFSEHNFKIQNYEYNFLIFSRIALKLLGFSKKHFEGVRPPFFLTNNLSRLDKLIPKNFALMFKPYDIVFYAKKI